MPSSLRVLVLLQNPKVGSVRLTDGSQALTIEYDREYLIAEGEDALNQAALAVLSARFGKPNAKYALKDPEPVVPCKLSQEEWEKMKPEDDGYQDALADYNRALSGRIAVENLIRENQAIRDCVANQNVREAFPLLQSRARFHGEDFEIIYARRTNEYTI